MKHLSVEVITKDGKSRPDAKRVKKLGEEISELIGRIDESYVEVASRLYQVHQEFEKCRSREDSKNLLGHESLKDWLAAVVGERGQRRAFYYMSIWKSLHEGAGIDAKELREIGWTRAKEVARIAKGGASAKQVKEWVERAKEATSTELTSEIKAAVSTAIIALPERVHVLRLVLYDNQHEIVIRALELVKSTGGAEKDNEAMAKICQEFLGVYAGRVAKTRDDLLGFLLANIEQGWGLKLLALDAATRKVMYGEEVLAWAAENKSNL